MFWGFCAATVHANAGPPVSLTDGDAVFLLPAKHGSLEITSENLTYDIEIVGREEVSAQVVAVYQMLNTSGEDLCILVAFVANNPATVPEVSVDGKRVGLIRTETVLWNVTGQAVYADDLLARSWSNTGSWTEYGVWEPTFEEILQFINTGQRTGDTDAGYDFEVSLFELDFPAKGARTLQVVYKENAAIIKNRKGYSYVNPTAEFYYFLEPARYWKDFAGLTVTINAPRGIGVETSLEGFVQKGDAFVAHFPELPSKNLRILAALEPGTFVHKVRAAFPWFFVLAGLALVLGKVAKGKKP